MKNNANLWTSNDQFEVEFVDGYILIRNNTNLKVLEVHNEPEIIEQNFQKGKDQQLWIKEDSQIDGFFTLKNLKWDKYLTAVSESSLEVQGKNLMEFGTIIFLTSLAYAILFNLLLFSLLDRISGTKVVVNFRTDHVVNKSGFHLVYNQISKYLVVLEN